MNVSVNFTKPIPDELYVDSFANGNTKTWTYTGNNIVYVTVIKPRDTVMPFGEIEGVQDNLDFRYNSDTTQVMVINATVDPDVAYYCSNTHIPDRIFVTETLIDGTTYQQISNPVLRDYYRLNYDFENTTWNWELIKRNSKDSSNDLADRYRDYVNSNITNISSNTQLMQIANTYLQALDTFDTTGKGSIPSWKRMTVSLGDVPPVPHDIIVALNVLP
jgi:hypothetical protein